MYTRQRIQKKTRTQSSSSPTETNSSRHRPAINEVDPTLQPQNIETPDLQAQLETATRFGHNFGRVSVQDSTPGIIQPKLAIGAPGDKYEQEADSVAAQVMSMNTSTIQQPIQRQGTEPEEEEVQMKPLASMITPLLQRQEAPEEEELQAKPLLQRQEAAEEEELQAKPLLQRQEAPEEEELQAKPLLQRAEASSDHASDNLENQLNSSKGRGSPLPDDVSSFMEPRFGADFSQVRVHTDSSAIQMNQAVGAQAFTHGRDIYFGAGKSPGVSDLTAHELTHVVQQTGAVQLKLSQPRNQFKQESKNTLNTFWQGQSFNQVTGENQWIARDEDEEALDGGVRDADVPSAGVPTDATDTEGGTGSSAASTPAATVPRKLDFITMKRKHIDLGASDKYGHWWTEIDGSESYGWWPKYPVGLKGTLFGVEGELNGMTSFGGTSTTDPHHGDSAPDTFHPVLNNSKSDATVRSEVKSFVSSYSGTWRWTFGFGQNCHTFQESLMGKVGLTQS